MTIEERIKEIEGRLASVPKGVWSAVEVPGTDETTWDVQNEDSDGFTHIADCGSVDCDGVKETAKFIANSKDDITFLLSELKRCREALEKITLGVHVDESHESTAMCAIYSLINVEKLARQALHPEGVK